MTTLAKALIQATAFLELSGEDVITRDGSVQALEDIAFLLRSASSDELTAIRQALQELATVERAGAPRQDVLKFYDHFLESFGLVEE